MHGLAVTCGPAHPTTPQEDFFGRERTEVEIDMHGGSLCVQFFGRNIPGSREVTDDEARIFKGHLSLTCVESRSVFVHYFVGRKGSVAPPQPKLFIFVFTQLIHALVQAVHGRRRGCGRAQS